MPAEKVNRLKDTAQAITSLDTPIGDDGAALQDFLEDDSAVGPDELAVEAVGREALEQVLNALPERERQVLILRFGLDSGTPGPWRRSAPSWGSPANAPARSNATPWPLRPRDPGPPGGPRRGLMRRFAITHDYLCPFARNAAEVVVRRWRTGAPVEVDFRAFSLSQVHLDDGEAPVWQPGAEPRSGVLALQWGLAVRDELPERFPAVHLALFAARHDQGRDLNDPEVLAAAVASAGVDPDEVEKLVAGGRPAAAWPPTTPGRSTPPGCSACPPSSPAAGPCSSA